MRIVELDSTVLIPSAAVSDKYGTTTLWMDSFSRHSHGGEGLGFDGLGIESLLLADDVVLMASSVCDLQLSLDRFADECDAAGMRISYGHSFNTSDT